MSDKENAPKKKGLVKRLMIPLVMVAALGGGGAVAGYFAAGQMGGHGPAEDPNAPKIVLKDGSTISAAEAGIAQKSTGKKAMGDHFKVTYYQIEQPFTANLRGNTGFMQASLAVSTYYDEKVVEALQQHDIAIRSAVILAISENDALSLESQSGKERLKTELKDTINHVLEEKTGFSGIDDVYFTNLVVQ
ncbi:MAG: flagellar basal body-associated FliL family protein [Blastomonas sp.]